mmetsp:Transcript_119950/g.267965  ORF Transcript_119950/g.267965 Transcript_119950/m.267965 type:complete len:337 (+) Transcript_119950:553-1563(+)
MDGRSKQALLPHDEGEHPEDGHEFDCEGKALEVEAPRVRLTSGPLLYRQVAEPQLRRRGEELEQGPSLVANLLTRMHHPPRLFEVANGVEQVRRLLEVGYLELRPVDHVDEACEVPCIRKEPAEHHWGCVADRGLGVALVGLCIEAVAPPSEAKDPSLHLRNPRTGVEVDGADNPVARGLYAHRPYAQTATVNLPQRGLVSSQLEAIHHRPQNCRRGHDRGHWGLLHCSCPATSTREVLELRGPATSGGHPWRCSSSGCRRLCRQAAQSLCSQFRGEASRSPGGRRHQCGEEAQQLPLWTQKATISAPATPDWRLATQRHVRNWAEAFRTLAAPLS